MGTAAIVEKNVHRGSPVGRGSWNTPKEAEHQIRLDQRPLGRTASDPEETRLWTSLTGMQIEISRYY